MNDDAILTPPRVCGHADVRLAHELMRQHLACRVDLCVWKAAAYYTLVDAGHLAPQTLTPRERAAARNIDFPPLDAQPPVYGGPPLWTLREVLDRLSDLALPVPDSNGTADHRN
ncbi:hypothetical protein OG874_05125 [Nocardia sp. NBC_00565]|uniref:hypothetical protein n=1 Tax=Nocardia sp. NBC_00565 TaxID=2975993 RepID=UPI002E818D21|nr:hypothetical protein [Nocardia sp. NBC_00565]WUC04576.1 hypothetical protein OG874_05125 [Nocardia sp. NBC_00565]